MNIWSSVIEKCEKRKCLDGSHIIYHELLSQNSVVDAISTYMMSIFPIPDGIIQGLDKARRDFLWKEK